MEDGVKRALALYREGKLSVKEAKRLSGLTWYDWAEVCVEAGLPWNIMEITPQELKRDTENALRFSRFAETIA